MLRAACCSFITSRVVWGCSGFTAHAADRAVDRLLRAARWDRNICEQQRGPNSQMLVLRVCYSELLITVQGILPPQLLSQQADVSQRVPADGRYLFFRAFFFAPPNLTSLGACGFSALGLTLSLVFCCVYTSPHHLFHHQQLLSEVSWLLWAGGAVQEPAPSFVPSLEEEQKNLSDSSIGSWGRDFTGEGTGQLAPLSADADVFCQAPGLCLSRLISVIAAISLEVSQISYCLQERAWVEPLLLLPPPAVCSSRN